MLVDVALDVLGLSGEPTAAEVRRAYLRQVKLHPPERDAEGFRRVREAYERLQNGYPVVHVFEPRPSSPGAEPPLVEAAPPMAAEPPSAAEPLPFPTMTQPVEEQLELVRRALANDDPLTAAEGMLWLYRRPLLESVPVPAPILALQTILALLQRGRFKRAGDLLSAMEDYVALNPQPGGFGHDVAARWKLVTELLATSQLDSRLARALASGLREGRMADAAGAADAALAEYGPELERHMRERAPTLWGQVAPLLSAHVPEAHQAPPARSGTKIGGWPGGLVALIVFNLIRLFGMSESPARSSVDYSLPSPHRDVTVMLPEAPADVSTAAPADASVEVPAASASPPVTSPPAAQNLAEALRTPAQRQTLAWEQLQQSTRIGDCQTVREQWRGYLALASGAHSKQRVETARKREILEMCPELHELLEEPP